MLRYREATAQIKINHKNLYKSVLCWNRLISDTVNNLLLFLSDSVNSYKTFNDNSIYYIMKLYNRILVPTGRFESFSMLKIRIVADKMLNLRVLNII